MMNFSKISLNNNCFFSDLESIHFQNFELVFFVTFTNFKVQKLVNYEFYIIENY